MRSFTLVAFMLTTLVMRAQLTNQGPDAPVVTIHFEQGMGFTFQIDNPMNSTNYQENYVEYIIPADTSADPYWRFQGYVLFQFIDEAAATDGNLFQNIHEQTLARPVLGLDKDDDVSAMSDTYDPLGPDDCGEKFWILANSGTVDEVFAVLDPFTNEPYVEGQTYCFVMMAFAYSPEHMDSACAELDQVIWSTHAPGGAISAQCVAADPFAGVSEREASLAFTLTGLGTDMVRCTFSDGNTHLVRILDASGRTLRLSSLRSGEAMDLGTFADGPYVLRMEDGPVPIAQRWLLQR